MISKINYLITGILSLFSFQLSAQTYHWAQSFGNSSGNVGKLIEVNSVGEVYGSFNLSGTVDCDPGSGVVNLSSNGGNDGAVQKLDQFGNLIWAKHIGGSGADVINGFTLDANDNLYVVGQFEGTMDADWNAGVQDIVSTSGKDGFLIKYNQNGDFLWAKTFASTGTVNLSDIKIDSSSSSLSIYIGGVFGGTVDLNPGTSTDSYTATGAQDNFVIKLDASGDYVWGKVFESTNGQEAKKLGVDNLGNIYYSGNFQGTIDLDPSAVVDNRTSNGNWDGFCVKLDANGNFVWGKTIGGSSTDKILGLSVTPNGDVFSAGFFQGTCDLDPGTVVENVTSAGSGDVFVQKLDASGNYIWGSVFSGSGDNKANAITVDDNGNPVLTGFFTGTCDFDPTSAVLNYYATGNDIFYASLKGSTGNLDKVFTAGSFTADKGNNIVTQGKNWYVTGYFQSTVDLNPLSAYDGHTSEGSFDVFYLKIDPCTNYDTLVITTCSGYGGPSGSHNWTSSGIYNDTLTNVSGCDSIITVDYTAVNQVVNNLVLNECLGFSIDVNGSTYSTSGNYSDTIIGGSSLGCDSIVNIDLTINQPSTGVDVQVACDVFTWINGVSYTSSNFTDTYTLTNASGCDSVVTLNLTLNQSSSAVETISSCGIYTWPANGQSYFQSGSYQEVLTNSLGCDSIVTLNLTVNLDYTFTDNISACDSYVWHVNGTTYTQSTSVTETFQTASGCDSVHILNLVLNSSSLSNVSVESCGSFIWDVNGVEYWNTGVYSDTLQSSSGCDSIIVLDLSIIHLNDSIFINNDGEILSTDLNSNTQYQWLDCNNNFGIIQGENDSIFTPSNNGSYAVELTHASCVDTSMCLVLDNVGLKENNQLAFSLFPNPTNGSFQINFSELVEGTLIVTDVKGQLILLKSLDKQQNVTVNLQDHSSGVYLVTLRAQQGTVVQRVLVE